MAQADATRVDNGSGFGVREGLNDGVEAGLTNSAGNTPPPVTIPGIVWWYQALAAYNVRDAANIGWERYLSFKNPDPPGLQNNEAAGFPVNALWGTTAGQMYRHVGNGAWVGWASGSGASGGTSDGFGIVDLGSRYVRDETEPNEPMVFDLGSRFVREE